MRRGGRAPGPRGATRRLGRSLAAAILLSGCASQSVEEIRPAPFDVGILLLAGSPSLAGWPAGDALRVSVTRADAPVAGAEAALDGAPLASRGAYLEPSGPLDWAPDSQHVVTVRVGTSTWVDTLRVPSTPILFDPSAGANLRGCADLFVSWSAFDGAAGAWILIEDSGGGRVARAARDPDVTSAVTSLPALAPGAALVGVLVLSAPLDSFPPDQALRETVPPGRHVLAWTELAATLLDSANPLETDTPDTLFVTFLPGDTARIAWSPDTVRAARVVVSRQVLAEGNLVWEIASDAGMLPPIDYGTLPADGRACVPPTGAPTPLAQGVEYLVEVIGRRHIGTARGVPAP